jgi:hypothetical protein
MTFRIERPRGPAGVRRRENDPADAAEESQDARLPVPVGPPAKAPRPDRRGGEAGFAAHLIGQDGQKRGLRAGAPVLSAAKRAYDRTEWSGSKDRRARKGRKARTEV